MNDYLIMCKSLTYAQRSARLLESAGIYTAIVRAPQELGREGCAYGLKINGQRTREAYGIIRNAGLTPGRIYRRDAHGGYTEVSA